MAKRKKEMTRQERYTERAKHNGIVIVQVRVPEVRRDELLQIAEGWRETHLSHAK